MKTLKTQIIWAPRVSREKILELYIRIASGNNDAQLIDEIALAFYKRCSDIIRIYERRFACPTCGMELPHSHQPHINLKCTNCGWQMDWDSFFRTYKGKQLSVNADVTDITRKYLNELPECKTPQEKMILIDGLIHACHEWVRKGVTYYGRPLAVNFIEGNMNQVVAFLENLPEGPDTLPEMNEQLTEWRKNVLSLFSEVEIERDKITLLVNSLPEKLNCEIEEMLGANHRQKAIARLRQNKEYSGEVKYHRGDLATQMVRMIEKRMKNKRVC